MTHDNEPAEPKEIDLDKLVELVYRLMQAEIRLSRTRGEAT